MKIIECPRDAMQGLHDFVPTDTKIDYINSLLKVGFDTIDFGSFVSPKAIPQMRDTAKVLEGLDLSSTKSKLLAIIANMRGAVDAAGFESIQYLGFPLSISETFQQRNTNKSIIEALNELEQIQNLCKKTNKTLVVYLSMGFGNPYNEPFNEDIVTNFTSIMATMEVEGSHRYCCYRRHSEKRRASRSCAWPAGCSVRSISPRLPVMPSASSSSRPASVRS